MRVITKSLARSMSKLFMSFYRRGVNDAKVHYDDIGTIRELLERTADGRQFGYIGSVSDSRLYWRNRILEVAEERRVGCFRQMDRYFMHMGVFGSNYLSAFMVLVQMFYNKGVEAYLEWPQGDMTAFNTLTPLRTWWKQSTLTSHGFQKFDTCRMRMAVQQMCLGRAEHIDNGLDDVLTADQYKRFMTQFSFAISAKA